MADIVDLLIDILFDPAARIDEKDDAAMDLGDYNDDRALSALISFAADPIAEKSVMDVCGESIARIWVERNQFDRTIFNKLHPFAQHEAEIYIKAIKPALWME